MTIAATISTCATATGEYVAVPSLRLDTLRLRLFPELSSASVSHEYGTILDGLTHANESPLDIRGQFVRIDLTDGTNSDTWTGYCPALTEEIRMTHPDPLDPSAPEVPSALQTFSVYGLDYFWDRPISGVKAASGRLGYPIGFNQGQDGMVRGNRAAAIDPTAGVYLFDGASTVRWNAIWALVHLLHLLAEDTGLTWALSETSQHDDLLDPIERVWPLESMTYRDAIRSLVSPAFGAALVVNGLLLQVVSILDIDLSADLPANANVVAIDLEHTHTMGRALLRHLETAHYDSITVRGARARVTYTVSVAAGSLVADWTAAEQTAFLASASAQKQEAYRHVFRRFRLSPTVDPLWPLVNPATGNHLPSLGTQPYYPPADGIETELSAYETSASTVETLYPALVFVEDPNDATKLVQVDAPGAGLPVSGVSVSPDRPALQLRPPYGQAFAGSVGVGNAAAGIPAAAYDYAKLVATITVQTNEHARVTVAAQVAEPGPISRELVLEIPEAHLWLVAPETRLSVTETTPAGSYAAVRDDSALLASIAAMAKAWYGRPRAAIEVSYATPLVLPRLGHVIQEARAAGTVTPAGTIISNIDYDLSGARQQTDIRTELLSLDLPGRFRPVRQARQMRQTRVREPQAESPVVKVRITGMHSDRPAGYPVFVGDLYAPGYETGTAKATGVTIMIPDIAASYTGPPSGVWTNLPIFSALGTASVWTGAAASHNETVYRVTDPFRWY